MAGKTCRHCLEPLTECVCPEGDEQDDWRRVPFQPEDEPDDAA